jgi:primosomal protein N' (replication factor Y) (superfamily II helicase)
MRFAEIIVNVPIRRSFRAEAGPEVEDRLADSEEEQAPASSLQTFHYHLPSDLEQAVEPGHLVWVPFGRQEVQGVVVGMAATAPVATKPVARLARPDPVFTPAQLALAAWIADTYVAPFSEAVKLFLPPGLLLKEAQASQVRAKRELQVELIADAATVGERLPALGRSLKYAAVLERLQAAGQPLWKSELYASVEADLALLRKLQSAGLVRLTERVKLRDPLAGRIYPSSRPPALTSEQASVWQQVREAGFWSALAADGNGGQPKPGESAPKFLLHGVTGSGKTEIYLRAIEQTLSLGRQAIVLVPEIALTPQTVARFAGRFPGRVTVIHSALNRGERYDVWRMVRNGDFDVVIGPRSALFGPLPRLGLIILDEEHESSYKQDSEEWGSYTVFYGARTVAHKLAELTGSMLILGSATPSLESYQAALRGEIKLLEMPRRVLGHRPAPSTATVLGVRPDVLYADMPPVEIIDMRQELRAGNRGVLSRSLQAELHTTLDAGEQAIFFINRRGTNTFILCRDCGHVQECTRCEIPLTYHERADLLICHRCNRRYPVPSICPACESKRIKFFGTGTQRVEEYIQQIAPRARLLRWDADTTTGKGSHDAILQRFSTHEADVLVGTQMIAKGLDLPLVTLVGVVAADVGLFLPDFRSGERTFQLLTQVAGRAGRSDRGGRVVIQSYRPDHYAIQAAAQHDYAAFYRREIAFRTEHGYPPVKRLARLVYWDKRLDKAQTAAEKMAVQLRGRVESMGLAGEAIAILGPAPAYFARRRSFYRWQILLRAPNPAEILRRVDIPFGWRVDIDPMTIL